MHRTAGHSCRIAMPCTADAEHCDTSLGTAMPQHRLAPLRSASATPSFALPLALLRCASPRRRYAGPDNALPCPRLATHCSASATRRPAVPLQCIASPCRCVALPRRASPCHGDASPCHAGATQRSRSALLCCAHATPSFALPVLRTAEPMPCPALQRHCPAPLCPALQRLRGATLSNAPADVSPTRQLGWPPLPPEDQRRAGPRAV